MKRHLYFLAALFIFFSCQENAIDYDEAIKNCRENKQEAKLIRGVGDTMITYRPAEPKCLIGSKCPKFQSHAISEKLINEETLKGNLNIINFWFTTCAPCIAEMPAFNHIVEKYGNRNINFISICNENEPDIKEFLEEREFKFEVIPNGKPIYRNIFKSPWGYPFTLVVDEKGIIIEAFSGGFTDEAKAKEKIFGILEPLILKHSSIK